MAASTFNTTHPMNSTTTHLNARQRFIQNLAESELFQHYQKAFNTLTSLPLNLEAAPEECHIDGVVTRTGVAGVVETKVPVRVGKNVIALMLTGAVRLQPANADTFAPVAKALLDEDRSAAEIRSAKVHFDHAPVFQLPKAPAARRSRCNRYQPFALPVRSPWTWKLCSAPSGSIRSGGAMPAPCMASRKALKISAVLFMRPPPAPRALGRSARPDAAGPMRQAQSSRW